MSDDAAVTMKALVEDLRDDHRPYREEGMPADGCMGCFNELYPCPTIRLCDAFDAQHARLARIEAAARDLPEPLIYTNDSNGVQCAWCLGPRTMGTAVFKHQDSCPWAILQAALAPATPTEQNGVSE